MADSFVAFILFLQILSSSILSTPAAAVSGEDVPYGTGKWDARKLGNHRAVVRVAKAADAVRIHIPWRRRDIGPEQKNILILEADTGAQVRNVYRLSITRESGKLIFQPSAAPSDYFVYYMPHTDSGRSNYPTVQYPKPVKTADPSWLERNSLAAEESARERWESLAEAQLVEIQSIDEFHSFYPMEVIATAQETAALLARHREAAYLLFPEDRGHPIRMTDDLPLRWIKAGPAKDFRGSAARGEFYAFQVGVYASRNALEDVSVRFSDLRSSASASAIPASSLRCINTGGVDWTGKTFRKNCSVAKGKVQALWMGIDVPPDQRPGEYEGSITVAPEGMKESIVRLTLQVSDEVLKDHGDGDPFRHSRLRWLDSTVALDDKTVEPYSPLEIRGDSVQCLGRRVSIGANGLPKGIVSYFAREMTHLSRQGRELLSEPVSFFVQLADGRTLSWRDGRPAIVRKDEGVVTWNALSKAGPLTLDCRARMEFDGNIEYEVGLKAASEIRVEDVRLDIPMAREVARYMMGLGFKGGYRPAELQWKWDPQKNQDSAWVGDVNAGLQFSLKDENYSRPLNTNFYLSKPLNMPPSWHNGGKGGCLLVEKGRAFLLRAYSGPRTIRAGEQLHFNFRLLLTPFKLLDTDGQWGTRFFHRYQTLGEIAAAGANTVNVHHATPVNPFINYPFLRLSEMKAYVDEAHSRGMKVKIYYTVRELSNRAPELFALRSLGDEVLSRGPGGGFAWLQEHLGGDYIAGWFVPQLEDAAVINSGVSRWHNYYLEGLDWLVRNVCIDGLYIDDVAFDRTVMKRVRKILDRGRKGALIDLHSANQFNVRDGFANSANLYLEHFPYLNRLWFGEYFDYNSAPDFWLVEISGIPFGLMGEMLQDGGNPWRGMLYGMTNRLPWAGNPSALWRLWDDFGMSGSKMIGYWADSCPVKTDKPDVLATTYVKKEKVLISVASWAKTPVRIRLRIDWKSLGFDPARAHLCAPAAKDFQDGASFRPEEEIPVQPGKGWLLILQE